MLNLLTDAGCAPVVSQLVKHERVDAVVVRDGLPKTMIGKLDRKALRELVATEA